MIVFCSNCELVNFLENLLKTFDWSKVGRREDGAELTKQTLCDGKIYKLHGDMEHGYRKINYFQFDK